MVKMTVHFTEVDMMRLVEIYKEYDCLWDMKHESYRDKEARQIAYKKIAVKLNIPNLREKDIPNKIKNLRSSYYQEIKKVRRSVRVGAGVYEPRVPWFETVDGFLRPFRHERDFIVKKPEKITKGDDKNVTITHKDDSNKTQQVIKQIDQLAERICPPSNIKMEDEFDSYGKYIASSLRSMPQEFSIIAKTELQKAISDIQLKIVRQNKAGSNQRKRPPSPDESESTLSDVEDQFIENISPTSNSSISTIKVEYDSSQ